MEGEIRERFFAGGCRVQRWTYTVRETWQTWMNARPDEGPFNVLSGMADFAECASEPIAKMEAEYQNEHARERGTLQTGTVVVP